MTKLVVDQRVETVQVDPGHHNIDRSLSFSPTKSNKGFLPNKICPSSNQAVKDENEK